MDGMLPCFPVLTIYSLSWQQRVQVPVASNHHQHVLLFFFVIMAFLVHVSEILYDLHVLND
jgi:hypothetical protein